MLLILQVRSAKDGNHSSLYILCIDRTKVSAVFCTFTEITQNEILVFLYFHRIGYAIHIGRCLIKISGSFTMLPLIFNSFLSVIATLSFSLATIRPVYNVPSFEIPQHPGRNISVPACNIRADLRHIFSGTYPDSLQKSFKNHAKQDRQHHCQHE